MVSVVSGSGLGLANTSREVVGPAGELGQAAFGRAGERVSVNAASGNLVIQQRDEFLVGIGQDIDLLRTYNSQGGWDGDNGDGWRIGYYRRVSGLAGAVNTAGSSIRRVDADGFESVYGFDGTRYVGRDGAGTYDSLAFNATTRIWTWADGDSGSTETYAEAVSGSGSFRLTQIADAEGHLVKVGHDGAGLITTLATWKADASAADETLTLSYDNATNKRLTQVAASIRNEQGVAVTRILTRYEYYTTGDAAGRLSAVHTDLSPEDKTVIDGRSHSVRYGYDASGRVNHLDQTGGASLDIVYDTSGRVVELSDALARVTRFTYDAASRKTVVTNALGQTTELGYDAGGRLLAITGAALGGSAFTHAFTYNANGDLVSQRNPQGEEAVYARNAAGAVVRSTDAAGNVVERGYDSANRLTLERLYTVPDPDGAAGTGLPAGALETQYLYETASGQRRLRFVISPEGRVTQHEYDPAGQRSASTSYLQASYTAGGSPALADLVAWASGLTPAQRAAVERRETTYDLRGQVILATSYAANSVSGSSVVYGGKTEQRYVRDAFGRLLQSIDAAGNATSWVYDGLGRVLATTDSANVKTLSSYDDAGNRSTLLLASGLATVSTYSKAGSLLSRTEMQGATTLGETRYFYDELDRLRMTQDPSGLRQWMLYDAAGRRIGDIDGAGRVTGHVYDAAGRLVQSTTFANVLAPATLTGLVDANGQPTAKTFAELRPALDAAADRIVTRFYDAAGRLVGLQDADGFVTETRYDGASRAVATVAFATATAVRRINVASGSTVAAPPAYALAKPAADAANDRVTRHFHSADGLLRGTLDAEGYLVEWRYDASGRRTEQIAYATGATASERASGTLAQLVPASHASDRRSVWLYDGQGQLVAEIDAEGYLTEHVHEDGQRRQSIRYALPAVQPVTSGSVLAGVRPVATARDQTMQWSYDTLGRVSVETAPDGTQTRFTHDQVGNLVHTVKALGQPEARTLQVRYDVQGRVAAELSAEGAARLTGNQTQAEIDAVWLAHGTSYAYDKAGQRISQRDARGSTTVFYFDAAGREAVRILKTPLGGEVEKTEYNGFGEIAARVVYARRLSTADANALAGGLLGEALMAKINALADATKDLRTATQYGRRGLAQRTTDGVGSDTDLAYNAFGQVTASTLDVDASRRVQTSRTYDRRGLLADTVRDTSGIQAVSRSEYDAFGRLVTAVDERGGRTLTQYLKGDGTPDSGRKVVVTGPTLAKRTTVYDAFDRVLSETDALNHTVTYRHDHVSRKMTMTTAEGIVTVTETTRHGQVLTVIDGNAATTRYTYDHNGNLLTTTDHAGNVARNTFDAVGNRVEVAVGLKSNGSSAATDDGSASLTRYTYDAANRVLLKQVDPNGVDVRTSYEYDGRSRTIRTTDALGVVTTHNFDAAGRLREIAVDTATGGLNLKTAYTYDAQGRTLRVTEGAGTAAAETTEYRYDLLGRRTHEIADPDGLPLTTRYEYDDAGNVILARDPLQQATRYVYDAAGRLKHTIDATKSVTQRLYDATGRLTGTKVYGKRLDGIGSLELTTNDAQLETAIAAASGANDALTQYAYDDDGRLSYSIDAVGAVTQQRYDNAGRVIETIRYATLKPGTWTGTSTPTADAARDQSTLTVYDSIGRARYTVDALNFVTETGYDRQGRVIAAKRYATAITRPATASVPTVASAVAARLDAANDRTEYFVHDAAGRLRFEVDAAGYATEHTYDDAGRRLDTWRALQPGSFSAPPALSQMAIGTRKSFTGNADGFAGAAHVYEANRIKLVSKPEAGGSYVSSRSTTSLPAGSSVSFDLTPASLQQTLHAGIDSGSGSLYVRVAILLGSDGTIHLQTFDRPAGVENKIVKLGSYTAGVTYRVEFSASDTGATVYVYDASKTRDSGFVYRTEGSLSWSEFAAVFFTNRNPALAGETVAYVDDLVERPAVLAGQSRYDAAGRRIASIDGEGAITRYAYDAAGRLTEETAAAGQAEASTTRRVYDRAGRVLEEIAAFGTGAAATTRYAYDAAGRLVKKIDPRGVALAEADTAWARSERVALSYPQTLAALTAVQKTELLERYATEYEYDATGRRTVVIDALGKRSTTTYDALGNSLSVKEESGPQTLTSYAYYDKLGRVVQQVDAERYLTASTYDAFGNRTDVVRYDARVKGTVALQSPTHLRIAVLAADPGNASTFVVSAASLDAASRSEFDRRNRLLWERDAEGYREGTLVALDAFGQRRSVVNKLDGTAHYVYDRLGRVTQETLPVTSVTATNTRIAVVNRHVYDHAGNRVQTLEAVGLPEERTTLYRYDNQNRLTRRIGMSFTAADGSVVTPVDEFSFDASGNAVEQIVGARLVNGAAVGGKRTLAWYDASGRSIAEASPDAALVRNTYDPAGNLVVRTLHATRLASLPASTRGAPPTVATSGDDRKWTYAYDALGRHTAATIDGVWAWENGETVSLAAAAAVTVESLTYDALGNVTQRTDGRKNSSFHYYDNIGRKLLSIDAEGYAIVWDYARSLATATGETRYAARLAAGSYRRQHDGSAVAAVRDPLTLRASVAALAVPTGEASRVKTFALDRLGRVKDERTLGVAYEYMQSNGTLVSRSGDAVTGYEYDGLGNVRRISQRVALLADNTTSVSEINDIGYDALGREVWRKAPGFIDFEGHTVVPRTDLQLDAFGNVQRRLVRGKVDTSEADDRITSYEYDRNGRMTEETDATGAVTRYAYGASGDVVKRTHVAVARSDGTTKRDLSKTYTHDAAGRIASETDADTGEVRRTRYNAFGEIEARALYGEWNESVYYTTLGKVWKSNAGDGAVKIYLHDKSGNVTREIKAAGNADLSSSSLQAASADPRVVNTVSVYDKRNLLLRTIEPEIGVLQSTATLLQQFTEQWIPAYKQLGERESLGGNYEQAVAGTQQVFTTVGTSASKQPALGVGAPTVATVGISIAAAPALTPLPAKSALAWDAAAFAFEPNRLYKHSKPQDATTSVIIPSILAASNGPFVHKYRVTETFNGVATVLTETAISGEYVPTGKGGSGRRDIAIATRANGDTAWVTIATGGYSKYIEMEPDFRGAFYLGGSTQGSNKLALDLTAWNAKSFRVTLDPNSAAPDELAVVAFDASTRLRLAQLPTNLSGSHVVRVLALDAAGKIVGGMSYTVQGSDASTLAGSSAVSIGGDGVAYTDFSSDKKLLRYASSGTDYGAPVSVRYRAYVASGRGAWSTGALTNGAFDVSAAGLAGGTYELMFEFTDPAEVRYGQFTLGNGSLVVAQQGSLRTILRSSEKITITGTPSKLVVLTLGSGEPIEAPADKFGVAVFDLAAARASLKIDRWGAATVAYSAVSYDGNTKGNTKITHADRGTLTFGSLINTASSPPSAAFVTAKTDDVLQYLPEARIKIPGAAGTVKVIPADGSATTTFATSGSNWRGRVSGEDVVVNLQDWLPPWGSTAVRTVKLEYRGNDGQVVTANFDVASTGIVTLDGTITQLVAKPWLPLDIEGAASLSVFKLGSKGTEPLADARSEISGANGKFTWNASQRVGQELRYYFEAKNAGGQVIGKGYGHVLIDADGKITHTAEKPILQPALLRLTPPEGTTSFLLETRPQGSTVDHQPQTKVTLEGEATRVFNLDALVPAAGQKDNKYDFNFIAKDKNGAVITKGKGTLIVTSTGTTTTDSVAEHRPVYVGFKVVGRNVPTGVLKVINADGSFGTARVTGVYTGPQTNADGIPERGFTRFQWDAKSEYEAAGTFDYELALESSIDVAMKDESGTPLVQRGRIVLDPSGRKAAEVLHRVSMLNQSTEVTVSRVQSHNAFGEVVEERDERVADRMKAMLGTTSLTAAQADAARTTLRYNALGQLVSKTDPEMHVTLENGYVYRERPVTRYGYDLLGRLVRSTDANGNASRQAILAGSPAGDARSSAEYFADGGIKRAQHDIFGDARLVTDQEGNVSRKTYDDAGRLIQVDRLGVQRVSVNTDGTLKKDNAAGTYTDRYTYDALGQRLTQRNHAGDTLTTDYDGLGRVVKTVSAQGFATEYDYDGVEAGPAGTLRTTRQASGRTTVDRYDAWQRLMWHQDLSGALTTYSYDNAARLVEQRALALHAGQVAGSATQRITYTYYANGYIQSLTDHAVGTVSEYAYDDAGNRTQESYFQLTNGVKGAAYQIANIRYDELNRIAQVEDANYFQVRYEYDAVGNRRLVQSDYWDGLAGLRAQQSYWYAYDSLNRFTTTLGSLNGVRSTNKTDAGKVIAGTEGTVIGYDKLSRRRSASYQVATTTTVNGKPSTTYTTVDETYGYSQDGYLETMKQGDSLKTVRVLDRAGRTLEYHDKPNQSITSNTFDRDGRLTRSRFEYLPGNSKDATTTYSYYSNASDSAVSATGAGELAQVVVDPDEGNTQITTYLYQYWDQAKQSRIDKRAVIEGSGDLLGSTTLSYNANGHLHNTYDSAAKLNTAYLNSASGLILQRERTQYNPDNQPVSVGKHFYYYADGRRIGDVSDDPSDDPRVSYAEQLAAKDKAEPDRKKLYKTFDPVTSADFDQNFEPINEGYPGPSAGAYTVAADGESLQGISQALWGDRAMWYLIAEANGLSGEESLKFGQVLVIPNKVTNIHNNAETFRPYSAGEAIGRIDPTLPAPPRADAGGCGGIGAIVAIVIAVVVTVWTAGAAAGAWGAVGTGMAGTTVGVTAATAATTVGTMSVGTAALAGGYGAATAIGAGVLGAAAGSIASQAFGMAAGMQNSFSWKQVGQAAIAGGITAGVGTATGWTGALGAAGNAAIGSGLTMAVQGTWDWRGIAASAIGAYAGAELGGTEWANSLGTTAQRLVAGMAAGAVGAYVGGGNRTAYVSAFTSTLTTALVSGSYDSQPGYGADDQLRQRAQEDFRREELQSMKRQAVTDEIGNQLVDVFSSAPSAYTSGANDLEGTQLAAGNGFNLDRQSPGSHVAGQGLQVPGQRSGIRFGQPADNVIEEAAAYDANGNYVGIEAIDSRTPSMSYGEQMRNVGRFAGDLAVGGAKGLYNLIPETAAFAYRMTGYAAAGLVSHMNTDVSDRMFAQYERVTGRVIDYDNGVQEFGGIAAQLASPLILRGATAVGARIYELDSIVQLGNVSMAYSASLTQSRLQVLISEGHGVQRHGAQVTSFQLQGRAVEGLDPMTGTRVDGVHGGIHQYAQHATKIVSDEAYVFAETYGRKSREFVDATTASATGRAQLEIPLKEIYGENFRDFVYGVTRYGPKTAPTGFGSTIFGDNAYMIIRYKQNSTGSWRFNTMFPQPE